MINNLLKNNFVKRLSFILFIVPILLMSSCNVASLTNEIENITPTCTISGMEYYDIPTNAGLNLEGIGNDTDGDLLTYSWAILLKPTGSLATLSSVYEVNTSIIPDLVGDYIVELTVTDGIDSSTATITIMAYDSTQGGVIDVIVQ